MPAPLLLPLLPPLLPSPPLLLLLCLLDGFGFGFGFCKRFVDETGTGECVRCSPDGDGVDERSDAATAAVVDRDGAAIAAAVAVAACAAAAAAAAAAAVEAESTRSLCWVEFASPFLFRPLRLLLLLLLLWLMLLLLLLLLRRPSAVVNGADGTSSWRADSVLVLRLGSALFAAARTTPPLLPLLLPPLLSPLRRAESESVS